MSTWAELTRALESQFGASLFDCPMAELFKLQQSGTIADYYLKFMALANRSEGLTPEALRNCFISGLNKDIRRDVVAQAPNETLLLRKLVLLKCNCEERKAFVIFVMRSFHSLISVLIDNFYCCKMRVMMLSLKVMIVKT